MAHEHDFQRDKDEEGNEILRCVTCGIAYTNEGAAK